MCQVVHVADMPEEIMDAVALLLWESEFFDSVPDDLLSDDQFLTPDEPVFAVEQSPISGSDHEVTLAQETEAEPAPAVSPIHAV